MNGSRDQIGARFLVLGLALEAMQGAVELVSLTRAANAVDEVFSANDPFALEVGRFARMVQAGMHRNPELLTLAGTALMRAVMRSCWPEPSPRADLEG